MPDNKPSAADRAALRLQTCIQSAATGKLNVASDCKNLIDLSLIDLQKIDRALQMAVKTYNPAYQPEGRPGYDNAAAIDAYNVGGVDVSLSPDGSGVSITVSPYVDVNVDSKGVNTVLDVGRSNTRPFSATMTSYSLSGDATTTITLPPELASKLEQRLKLAEHQVQEKQKAWLENSKMKSPKMPIHNP